MQDFLNSGPLDRHYVLDHIRGEIGFGDSRHGMIPPVGVGNMVATTYRTGGGSSGNRPPGTINSLKTTIPYVERVINFEAAVGGVDAEEESQIPVRGPAFLRHRERAVTREDYEDLAMLASAEVGVRDAYPRETCRRTRTGTSCTPARSRLSLCHGRA